MHIGVLNLHNSLFDVKFFHGWMMFPLVAILVILCLPNNSIKLIKFCGFFFLFMLLFGSFILLFLTSLKEPMHIHGLHKIYCTFNSIQLFFSFGWDSLSALFLVLTLYIVCLCCVIGFNTFTKSIKLYFILYLSLLWCLIIVFTSYDLLIFYFFFESLLIPMFMLIGFWGSRSKKIKAAYLLFFYTLLSSLFFLAVILYLILKYKQAISLLVFSNLYGTQTIYFTFNEEFCIWVALFLSFATKIPMMPFHLWLPEAHVEAPTSGSMLLAGVLLKLGVFGILKFLIPLAIHVSFLMKGFVFILALFSLIFAALTAIRQIDLKRIIAYASISHMNLIVLGIFTFTQSGYFGAVLQSLSHGFVATLLFMLIGVLYERYHTRNILYYGGLSSVMPLFSICFFIAIFCNMSFPGSSNFIGEFLLYTSLFQSTWGVCAIFSLLAVILNGLYSLWLLNRIIYGNVKNISIFRYIDLSMLEIFQIISLLVPAILLGIYPDILLKYVYMYPPFI